jgi:hypothetical protein
MTDTTTTTAVEEFDPLEDPQIAAFYNRLKKHQGQAAADRYLLTAKPAGGMNAFTPAVATTSTNGKAKPPNATQTVLVEPLPTPALPSSGALPNAILSPDEATTAVEPAPTAGDVEPTASQHKPLADTTPAAIETAVETEEPPEATVSTAAAGKTDQADSPETAVTRKAKGERRPARSTAAVKQAFEDALAAFIEADRPFKRSHVVQRAGLGASFYDRYPSLRTKVDTAIANVGKPNPQLKVETMPSEVNGAPSAPSATPDQPLVTETVHNGQSQVNGLAWSTLEAGLKHWQQERDRITAQITQLEKQLDEVIDNVNTHERIWALYGDRYCWNSSSCFRMGLTVS